jgi:hypothetical protein
VVEGVDLELAVDVEPVVVAEPAEPAVVAEPAEPVVVADLDNLFEAFGLVLLVLYLLHDLG